MPRVLLVDNSEGGKFTRKLIAQIRGDGHELVVVDKGDAGNLALGELDEFDAAILSGGPPRLTQCNLIRDFAVDLAVLSRFTGPKFGVCFGMQMMAVVYGGEVQDMGCFAEGWRELHNGVRVMYAYHDEVTVLPPTFQLRQVCNGHAAAMASKELKAYATQYHPEDSYFSKEDHPVLRFLRGEEPF